MRISDQHYFESLRRGLVDSGQSLQKLNLQLTSGKRLSAPSDDPVSAGLILRARADVQRYADQQGSLQTGISFSSAADGPLGQIAGSLRTAMTTVQQALSDSTPAAARGALAVQIESLLPALADEANRSVAGRYLFGGTEDAAPPVIQDATGAYQYRGDDGSLEFPVAPGRTAPANVAGSAVLNFTTAGGDRAVPEVDADVFAVLQDTAAKLRAGDREGLRESYAQIEGLYQNAVRQRGLLGAHTVRLQSALASAQAGESHCKILLSDQQDTDVVEAVTEMKRLEVVYQAATLALSKVASLPSIFEALR